MARTLSNAPLLSYLAYVLTIYASISAYVNPDVASERPVIPGPNGGNADKRYELNRSVGEPKSLPPVLYPAELQVLTMNGNNKDDNSKYPTFAPPTTSAIGTGGTADVASSASAPKGSDFLGNDWSSYQPLYQSPFTAKSGVGTTLNPFAGTDMVGSPVNDKIVQPTLVSVPDQLMKGVQVLPNTIDQLSTPQATANVSGVSYSAQPKPFIPQTGLPEQGTTFSSPQIPPAANDNRIGIHLRGVPISTTGESDLTLTLKCENCNMKSLPIEGLNEDGAEVENNGQSDEGYGPDSTDSYSRKSEHHHRVTEDEQEEESPYSTPEEQTEEDNSNLEGSANDDQESAEDTERDEDRRKAAFVPPPKPPRLNYVKKKKGGLKGLMHKLVKRPNGHAHGSRSNNWRNNANDSFLEMQEVGDMDDMAKHESRIHSDTESFIIDPEYIEIHSGDDSKGDDNAKTTLYKEVSHGPLPADLRDMSNVTVLSVDELPEDKTVKAVSFLEMPVKEENEECDTAWCKISKSVVEPVTDLFNGEKDEGSIYDDDYTKVRRKNSKPVLTVVGDFFKDIGGKIGDFFSGKSKLSFLEEKVETDDKQETTKLIKRVRKAVGKIVKGVKSKTPWRKGRIPEAIVGRAISGLDYDLYPAHLRTNDKKATPEQMSHEADGQFGPYAGYSRSLDGGLEQKAPAYIPPTETWDDVTSDFTDSTDNDAQGKDSIFYIPLPEKVKETLHGTTGEGELSDDKKEEEKNKKQEETSASTQTLSQGVKKDDPTAPAVATKTNKMRGQGTDKEEKMAFLRFVDHLCSITEKMFKPETTPTNVDSSYNIVSEDSKGDKPESAGSTEGENIQGSLPDSKAYEQTVEDMQLADSINSSVHNIVDGDLATLLNKDGKGPQVQLYYSPVKQSFQIESETATPLETSDYQSDSTSWEATQDPKDDIEKANHSDNDTLLWDKEIVESDKSDSVVPDVLKLLATTVTKEDDISAKEQTTAPSDAVTETNNERELDTEMKIIDSSSNNTTNNQQASDGFRLNATEGTASLSKDADLNAVKVEGETKLDTTNSVHGDNMDEKEKLGGYGITERTSFVMNGDGSRKMPLKDDIAELGAKIVKEEVGKAKSAHQDASKGHTESLDGLIEEEKILDMEDSMGNKSIDIHLKGKIEEFKVSS
ncbi:hypothetical protein BgAZ_502340 [Babesia gibsoni]|uniref:Uncharacterized protein n=1 Tax=Babesia gibsoni TaxID=33632 RepID=A0AAD8PD74_BABGI|nr:hypothetical protein BgAZ_502340 [Babesia gibsoni]